ncbi:glycosyltransferase family 4 protein [Ktedonospora formicarum]|uniref:Glycosyl transferase family 1 n=1 Tax=Ktedonospora formicarum TaxID=2778364 RepID=A0A8J3HZB1_9CHLR|nr:glycosyltransferase family 4 protein [Ktedonospora formicarum]GHO43890.1 glycosyl transferase family 1 [Ktedonospora formicarum]
MRIALLAPLVTPIAEPFLGGAQALVANLARGLNQRGHKVTLFARQGSSVPGVEIETFEVPESVIPATFAGPMRERPADDGFFSQANVFLEIFLRLRQRQEEFDLLHAHAFDWPAFTLSTILTRIPILHTIHLPAVSPEINESLRLLHQQGHPLRLITVSQACARTYETHTPFDHIIYNGLDIASIPFAPEVDSDAPLLFAGRITPEKGVEAALDIAERTGIPLLLAGGIYDNAYYEQRIAPRLQEMGERARYLGALAQDKLWQLMGQTRGLLFTSTWDEPFGLTMVEAMATGTPVLAFERGAAAEVIRHGETGYLISPNALEQAVQRVRDLPTIQRTRCRQHVEQSFSFDAMLDRHEQAYSSAIMKHISPN